MPIGDRILKRMERLRELRLEYGPLIKLLERNERLRKFMEKRPIIASLIEKFKPEILEPSDFESKFREDLKIAEKTVLIMSPFVTTKRVNDLGDILKEIIAKGVEVEVQLLDPKHPSIRNKEDHHRAIQTLENLGVNVEKRMYMHEKAIIVDNKVAYLGSINCLSKYSYERKDDYMLRYSHPELVEFIRMNLMTMAEASDRIPE